MTTEQTPSTNSFIDGYEESRLIRVKLCRDNLDEFSLVGLYSWYFLTLVEVFRKPKNAKILNNCNQNGGKFIGESKNYFSINYILKKADGAIIDNPGI